MYSIAKIDINLFFGFGDKHIMKIKINKSWTHLVSGQNYIKYNIEKNKSHQQLSKMPSKCITCKLQQAVYNYTNKQKPAYCKDCKLDDMADVENKKCVICKLKIPNFNYPDERQALYCNSCRKIWYGWC